jgi:hypothetical protein
MVRTARLPNRELASLPILKLSVLTMPSRCDDDIEWLVILELEETDMSIPYRLEFNIADPDLKPCFTSGGTTNPEPILDAQWGIVNVSFPLKDWKVESVGEYCAHLHLNGELVTTGRIQVAAGLFPPQ